MEEDGGPGLVEYALVTVLVAIVVIVIMALIPQAVYVDMSGDVIKWIALGAVGIFLLVILGVGCFGGRKEQKRKTGNKRGKTKNG